MSEKDGFTESDWELGESAIYNLENIVRMVPSLQNHPMYSITHKQLRALVDRLEARERGS